MRTDWPSLAAVQVAGDGHAVLETRSGPFPISHHRLRRLAERVGAGGRVITLLVDSTDAVLCSSAGDACRIPEVALPPGSLPIMVVTDPAGASLRRRARPGGWIGDTWASADGSLLVRSDGRRRFRWASAVGRQGDQLNVLAECGVVLHHLGDLRTQAKAGGRRVGIGRPVVGVAPSEHGTIVVDQHHDVWRLHQGRALPVGALGEPLLGTVDRSRDTTVVGRDGARLRLEAGC